MLFMAVTATLWSRMLRGGSRRHSCGLVQNGGNPWGMLLLQAGDSALILHLLELESVFCLTHLLSALSQSCLKLICLSQMQRHNCVKSWYLYAPLNYCDQFDIAVTENGQETIQSSPLGVFLRESAPNDSTKPLLYESKLLLQVQMRQRVVSMHMPQETNFCPDSIFGANWPTIFNKELICTTNFWQGKW